MGAIFQATAHTKFTDHTKDNDALLKSVSLILMSHIPLRIKKLYINQGPSAKICKTRMKITLVFAMKVSALKKYKDPLKDVSTVLRAGLPSSGQGNHVQKTSLHSNT